MYTPTLCTVARSPASSRYSRASVTPRISRSSLRRTGLLETGHRLRTTPNTETIFVPTRSFQRYKRRPEYSGLEGPTNVFSYQRQALDDVSPKYRGGGHLFFVLSSLVALVTLVFFSFVQFPRYRTIVTFSFLTCTIFSTIKNPLSFYSPVTTNFPPCFSSSVNDGKLVGKRTILHRNTRSIVARYQWQFVTNECPWADEPLGAVASRSSTEALSLCFRSLFGIAKQFAAIGAGYLSRFDSVAALGRALREK